MWPQLLLAALLATRGIRALGSHRRELESFEAQYGRDAGKQPRR